MASYKVYSCAIDETVTEVKLDEKGNPINLSFSVYETEDGQEIAICPRCKRLIESVCKEMLVKNKLLK